MKFKKVSTHKKSLSIKLKDFIKLFYFFIFILFVKKKKVKLSYTIIIIIL